MFHSNVLITVLVTGCLTLNSSFPGEPEKDKVSHRRDVILAVLAALVFSIIITDIQNTFDVIISKRDVATNRNPNFASVIELIFFSCMVATVFSSSLVYGSHEYLIIKKDIRVFGRKTYVGIMLGQVFAWQIYWVGLVGLAFAVSDLFSNVISVGTWPIVSILTILFFDFDKDVFDAFKGVALACAFLSAGAYFYWIHQDKRNTKPPS